MSASPNATDPVRKHQRELWLRIIAPVAVPLVGLVLLCVVLAISVLTGALVGKQVTTLMGIVATVFIVFPLTLACLVPYFVLVLSAYGAGRVYAHSRKPLRFSRRLTEQIATKTNQVAPKVARPLIGLNTRTTRWEHALREWVKPTLPTGKESTDEGS
jgi:hypothetical protein